MSYTFRLRQNVRFHAMTYVCVNLLVDILYGWLDPRIKYA
jgi:ABC-type dipeptide/oligopeptide/nickel transport system permease component